MRLSSLLASITFAAALTALPTAASAIPFATVSDPTPNVLITPDAPYEFTMLIQDGFSAALHDIQAATLLIRVQDEQHANGSEEVIVELEGTQFNEGGVGAAETPFIYNFGSLNILSTLADGQLVVTMSATPGNGNGNSERAYYFNSAVLSGTYDRKVPGSQDVPEPTTLALMGIVLLGAGLAGRRLV